ncbi:hypothetical protein QTP86_022883 [Hemibagrus guttatus]|nr:hypothetical protein QTP86_022883 [Hemibagrus guttatus]
MKRLLLLDIILYGMVAFPQKPIVDIFGGNSIGDSITVRCKTYHTCPYNKPSLSLSGIEKKFGTADSLESEDHGDGNWKITLTRVGVVRAERQNIQCSVRHSGGLSASTTKTHSAKCSVGRPSITPDSNTEFLEGVEQDITCFVTYMCSSDKPNIVWNNGQLKGIQSYREIQDTKFQAKSTLKFTAKADDNGKTITCQSKFEGTLQSTTITLKVKSPIDQVQIKADTEFLEGVEQNIVCFVTYMCAKDRPYINWNGEELPGSTFQMKKEGIKQFAKSTIKFKPRASDNGKTITCLADFKGNVQTAEITLSVQRSMGSLDWSFTMPNAITAIRGSCVVIPCNYEFKNVQHSKTNVKWYKLSNTGYSLVYDQPTHNIIQQFRGKTSLFGSSNDKNCSLKIQPLDMQHSQERLFPWMDPNPIESYHSKNFDHVTIALEVTDIVQIPQADLLGTEKVGEPITLSCSVTHTCPPTPPKLSLSISRGTPNVIHTPLNDGKWKETIEITWTLEENDKSVTCTVSYAGGQSTKTEINLNPLCEFHKPVISPAQEEVMERIEKSFTCTVNHTCQKEKPNIIWNYQNMPVSVETHKVSSHSWQTVSTLKLKASRDDHGKTLTCTAQTTKGVTSDHVTLKVKRGMFSLDWTYSMPSKITGLRGSCMVIPCSFDFKREKHSNVEVKWYLYSSNTYPLVYDPDNKNVLDKYIGKTRLYGLPSEKNCSLEITQLETQHNADRLYPWMDPKSVQTFHKENYYDKSIELQVKDQADKPKLSITGIPRVGEQISVSCSVLYTCPPNPPSLSVGKALETDITVHTPVQDGFWEITRIHTFIIKEEEPTVTCKATFQGGQTSEAQIDLKAQCTYKDITIDPEVADVVEGVGKNFTCTVFHSCKGQPPAFTWNYKDVPETAGTKKGPSLTWATYSNILYIASLEDDGKKLTCTATFPGGEITNSIVLQVQRYVPKVVDPFENDTVHIFEANVAPKISALTRSCVVIPCTFQTGDMPIMRLRGLWYTSNGEYVYHTGRSNIMDNFKGRTKLLGNPDEQNCTLEIDNVQAHDNGPFCFHAEKGNDKYRFNHSCVFIIMKASPDKPVISALPHEMEPGKRFTINCTVTHTCSSHPPKISWNVQAAREVVSHVKRSAGKWETTSTITFIPTGYEEEDNLICSALFWKGKKEESSTLLSVKRYEGLGMDTVGLYIILPLFSFLLLSVVIGIIIYRTRVQKNHGRRQEPDRNIGTKKSTTDAIFALRILMEKYMDGQRELHRVFVDLEKAYDRVPREELWYCMRKSGVAEKYVRVVQDMYERSRTVVRCAVGQTEEFKVEVGLHQGSALSPFLFAIGDLDQLSEEVRQESPWTMMFADDIVICSESREQVEENLERWRFALERRGMKVSRRKTEYMCVNEREGSGTVRLQGEEVKKVQEFKYLGSTVQSNGECGKEVKKRVQAGWNGWRKVSEVLCDRKISARIKGKVYRTVVRPAMLYGLETVSLKKRQESELEVAELKMLSFSLGVTRLDRIRNKYIRGTAHVGRLGDKVREGSMYIEKSRGPKTDPCGTPYFTGITLDSSPFKSTKWYRSDSHFLQLFRRDPKAFPGQPKDIVSPACPGSSPGPLPGGACPEHLSRETSWRHPKQMPEPPQLSPFDVEEQRLYSELLPGDRAPYPISKGAPRHPTEEAHFGRLYPGSYPFGHDPELMTIGILFSNTWAWEVKMPSSIHGLHKSCLVIPCKFSYSSYPPQNPSRILWYQYVNRGYPLVFDAWNPTSVIDKYRGKTSLYKNTYRDCSLVIDHLRPHHNGDRLYTWIDPDTIGWTTFKFYDVSTLIHIDSFPQKPIVDIFGGNSIGDSITVRCKTYHTCPYNKPSLSLSGIEKKIGTEDNLESEDHGDGNWKITLTRVGVVRAERQNIQCSVEHSGGLSANTTKTHSTKCTYKDITIDPEVADVVEGVGKNFTCTVFHSCKDQAPAFTWNYKDVPETVGTKKGPSLTWATYSNILYIASLEDDGKKLTCTATFPGGEITNSIVLQVQRHVPKVVDPFENDTVHIFEANVAPKISALTRSCVVIPCTFQTGDMPIMRLRGLWYTSNGEYVYHTGRSNIMDNFKGRTKLLGNPDEQNCTLEIDNVQVHDNGPFCFHAEKGNDKYRFNHSCVFIIMKASPDKPVISALPHEMEPGKRFTINCTVTHTCSSHPPKISWNVQAAREVVSHVKRSAGKWETTSTITFIPTGYEEEDNLICSALFWKGKKEESSTLLSVKREYGKIFQLRFIC